jgi:hypothetical protein
VKLTSLYADMMVQTREQVRACLMKKRDGADADSSLDMQRQQIEANQTNTLKLCTEKVLLAQQAYDLVNSSIFHISCFFVIVLFLFLSFFLSVPFSRQSTCS